MVSRDEITNEIARVRDREREDNLAGSCSHAIAGRGRFPIKIYMFTSTHSANQRFSFLRLRASTHWILVPHWMLVPRWKSALVAVL
jgi:hypothetical protein